MDRSLLLWFVFGVLLTLWSGRASAQDAGAADAGIAPDSGAATGSDAGTAVQEEWCPPGVETLASSVCAVVPDPLPDRVPRTLVVFLHGVVQPGSGWQQAPIRGLAAAAKRLGFVLIAPRGRQGVGRAEMRDWWAWPTSANAQQRVETEVLEEWASARRVLEARSGKPFDKVLVFGFSSGAYYASSLALRGRLTVDGYAVFAGGAAPYPHAMMSGVRTRVPIFVGYGLKDKAAVKDARKLLAALRALHWRHKEMAVPRVGHTVTDKQLKEALAYLRK